MGDSVGKINIPKTRNILNSLLILHNEVRSMIFIIVLGAEEEEKELNIREIHEELKKREIMIAYKNCALYVNELEKAGLLQIRLQKYKHGREKIITPTKKAHNIAKFLFNIKDTFF